MKSLGNVISKSFQHSTMCYRRMENRLVDSNYNVDVKHKSVYRLKQFKHPITHLAKSIVPICTTSLFL
jgi:hypothetical protein